MYIVNIDTNNVINLAGTDNKFTKVRDRLELAGETVRNNFLLNAMLMGNLDLADNLLLVDKPKHVKSLLTEINGENIPLSDSISDAVKSSYNRKDGKRGFIKLEDKIAILRESVYNQYIEAVEKAGCHISGVVTYPNGTLRYVKMIITKNVKHKKINSFINDHISVAFTKDGKRINATLFVDNKATTVKMMFGREGFIPDAFTNVITNHFETM